MPSGNISLTRTQCNGPTYNSRLRNICFLGQWKRKNIGRGWWASFFATDQAPFLYSSVLLLKYSIFFLHQRRQPKTHPVPPRHLVQRPRALATVFIYIRGKSCVYELIASYLYHNSPTLGTCTHTVNKSVTLQKWKNWS